MPLGNLTGMTPEERALLLGWVAAGAALTMMTLVDLKAMPPQDFVAALSGVFEHSDWVAVRAARCRPVRLAAALLSALRARCASAPAMPSSSHLIRAHPDLRARGVRLPALTAASQNEQRRAGLEGCTPAEAARLEELNGAYQARFGFPFILAVRGHDPASIIRAASSACSETVAAERATALEEIGAHRRIPARGARIALR